MKVVIDHIAGSRRGQRQELDSAARIRFGRHPDNEVSFDAHRDLDASSRHAELVRDGDKYILSDIGSSNGLLVDGDRVHAIDVSIGEAVEVCFGASGPRVRLFIGDPADIPDPPSASSLRVPRTPSPTRVFAHEAVHRLSRRSKLVMIVLVAVLLAAIGVFVLRQIRERDRAIWGRFAEELLIQHNLTSGQLRHPNRCIARGFARK